jgi:hypothetical protein
VYSYLVNKANQTLIPNIYFCAIYNVPAASNTDLTYLGYPPPDDVAALFGMEVSNTTVGAPDNFILIQSENFNLGPFNGGITIFPGQTRTVRFLPSLNQAISGTPWPAGVSNLDLVAVNEHATAVTGRYAWLGVK